MDHRIEKITAWITTDGSVHRDGYAAQCHQDMVDLRDHYIGIGFTEKEAETLAESVCKKFKVSKFPHSVSAAG